MNIKIFISRYRQSFTGDIQAWRYKLGKVESPACRKCGVTEETGSHVVFECPEWKDWQVEKWVEGKLWTWESWEDPGSEVWVEMVMVIWTMCGPFSTSDRPSALECTWLVFFCSCTCL